MKLKIRGWTYISLKFQFSLESISPVACRASPVASYGIPASLVCAGTSAGSLEVRSSGALRPCLKKILSNRPTTCGRHSDAFLWLHCCGTRASWVILHRLKHHSRQWTAPIGTKQMASALLDQPTRWSRRNTIEDHVPRNVLSCVLASLLCLFRRLPFRSLFAMC